MRKLKKIAERIAASFSDEAAERFYTNEWKKRVQQSHPSVRVKGKFHVSDSGNIVAGKDVVIGKNCRFYSEGGVYLEDGLDLVDGSVIRTYAKDFFPDLEPAFRLGKLSPKILSAEKKTSVSEIRHPDFFIVSTGRSGTNALAKMLNRHSFISCFHEPRFVLNRLSTEYAHGFKSREEVKEELVSLYTKITFHQNVKNIFGECDQKYVNLMPILKEIFPEAKFIWLIRRAEDFVASAYGRRWFDEYEYTFPEPKKSHDTSNDFSLFDVYRIPYSKFRLNGAMAGLVKADVWNEMGCFERCCWYWKYWNELIETNFQALKENEKLFIRLEDIEKRKNSIFSFLDLKSESIDAEQTNQAYYKVVKKEEWTPEQQDVFEKWCNAGMKKWYGE